VELQLSDVQPFLNPNPLPSKKETLVTAWCPVLAALLTARYGGRITEALTLVFVSTAADAIQRRLDKPNRMVNSQAVNGASVSYSASLRSWFYEEELAQLDSLVGAGGIRTYRTPTPDGIRFGNMVRRVPEGSNGF
jgi:guanyl-specific ribonuclease Sa